jgi:hypothetical protein
MRITLIFHLAFALVFVAQLGCKPTPVVAPTPNADSPPRLNAPPDPAPNEPLRTAPPTATPEDSKPRVNVQVGGGQGVNVKVGEDPATTPPQR